MEPEERPEPPLPWRRAGEGPHTEAGAQAEEDEEEGGSAGMRERELRCSKREIRCKGALRDNVKSERQNHTI